MIFFQGCQAAASVMLDSLLNNNGIAIWGEYDGNCSMYVVCLIRASLCAKNIKKVQIREVFSDSDVKNF